MERFKLLLGELAPVMTFDYDYATLGKKRPDPLPQLISAHRRAWETGSARWDSDAVFVGKSMGSRVGCHLAQSVPARALVCFGYPLVGAGPKKSLRDEALLQIDQPICFFQGTRDALCPLPELERVLRGRAGKSVLHVIETGDHSLLCTKTHLKTLSITQADVERSIQTELRRFLMDCGLLEA